MKKILILFLLISACGYQPLYNSNKISFEFSKINLSGDTKINRKIISLLGFIETNNNDLKKEISIESSKSVIETSKNNKGQPATYRTNVIVIVSIKNQDKVIKTKSFEENFSYKNIENKYDLSVYQKNVENNLIKKITNDLIVFINL
tara:strand:+ start:152 stop:592 length:441 start_codon:yes stop_codon:yes gene_type:complete